MLSNIGDPYGSLSRNRAAIMRLLATGMLVVFPLAASAQSAPYDGDYTGVGTLTTDPATIKQGNSCAKTLNVTVHVRNGQVSMTRQVQAETVTVTNAVGAGGSISAFGPSRYGGVNLKGKIDGAGLTGTSASVGCAYRFTSHKR
jgi:hypothetical protein